MTEADEEDVAALKKALDAAGMPGFRRPMAALRLAVREAVAWSGTDGLTLAGFIELAIRECGAAGMPDEAVWEFRRRHGM